MCGPACSRRSEFSCHLGTHVSDVRCGQLPPQILSNIFSCLSSRELTRLTVVNRTYQVEAERLLYKSITFCRGDRGRLVQCLETLSRANSHHRLAWIRSLSINLRVKPALLKSLCEVLPEITLLQDLHLILSSKRYIALALYKTFQCCTFSLTTLGLDFDLVHALVVGGWLLQHSSSLTTLVIYATPLWDPELGELATFNDMLRKVPPHNRLRMYGIASLSRIAHIMWCFPLLPTPGEFSGPWTAQPLHGFMDTGLFTGTIAQFHVYLNALSDGALLRHVLASIAEHFPNVENLSLYINDPEIHRHVGVASTLALLPLEDLYIVLPPGTVLGRRHKWQERRAPLTRTWTTESPALRFVHFPDSIAMYRNADTWTEITIDECEKLKAEILQVQLEQTDIL